MRRGINLDLVLCYGCFHVRFLAEEQKPFCCGKVLADTFLGVGGLNFSDQNPLDGETICPSTPSFPSPTCRSSVEGYQLVKGDDGQGKTLVPEHPVILASLFKMRELDVA